MTLTFRERRREEGIVGPKYLNHNRPCVICARPSLDIGEMCGLHRQRRRSHGHPKVRQGLRLCEWRPILPAVLRYIKENPPSAEVLASVGRLIEPGNAPPPSLSRLHPRRVFYSELAWWQQPESRKVHRRWNYSPRGILSRLVAAQVVLIEQERRFPGAAPEIELARTIAWMFRRPKRASGRRGKRVSGAVLRGLAERIKQSVVGVYLLVSARALMRQREQEQEEISKRPRKSTPPPPTIWTPPHRVNRVEELKQRFGITIKHS
jgi:hypothetical protein